MRSFAQYNLKLFYTNLRNASLRSHDVDIFIFIRLFSFVEGACLFIYLFIYSSTLQSAKLYFAYTIHLKKIVCFCYNDCTINSNLAEVAMKKPDKNKLGLIGLILGIGGLIVAVVSIILHFVL